MRIRALALSISCVALGCASSEPPPATFASRATALKNDGPDAASLRFRAGLEEDARRKYANLPPLTQVGDPALRDIFLQMSLPGPPRRKGPPTRGETVDSVAIDFASLPAMTDIAGGENTVGGSFMLLRAVPTHNECPPGTITRERTVWTVRGLRSQDARVSIGGKALPAAIFEGDYEDGVFSFDNHQSEPLDAEWLTLDDASRTATTLDVTRFEGTFAPQAMRAKATHASTVRAAAVIPGVAYAFTRCITQCSQPLGSPARKDVVELIAPAAVWASTSADTAKQLIDLDQRFTDLAAPISPGSSASLFLVASADSVRSFRADAQAPNPAPFMTISLEVIWPEGGTPELTVFSGEFRGDEKTLRVQTPRAVPPPRCIPDYADR